MATIFDRFRAKAIATYYAESPFNKMEFAGKTIFPAKRNASMDLSWFKGAGGLPVQLKNSTLGAKATIRDRVGFKEVKTDMPFFREAMQIGEKERQQLVSMMNSPESEFAKMYVSKIYDDAGQLIQSADVTAELMRMQLLSTGVIGVTSNGVTYDYDFGLGAGNKETLAGGDLWTDPAADVLGQITEWQDAVETLTGERPSRAICHGDTAKLLRGNTGIKLAKYAGLDPTKVSLTEKDVLSVLSERVGIDLIIYSKKYSNSSGIATNFFPAKVFTLLPAGTVGSTYYAPSPEEVDKMALSQVADVEIVSGGVSVTSLTIPHPVNREIIVSAIMLPSAENIDKIFIGTVAV